MLCRQLDATVCTWLMLIDTVDFPYAAKRYSEEEMESLQMVWLDGLT